MSRARLIDLRDDAAGVRFDHLRAIVEINLAAVVVGWAVDWQ